MTITFRRLRAIALWLILSLLAGSGFANGQALPETPDLLFYPGGAAAWTRNEGEPAQLNLDALRALLPGALVNFRTPDGHNYPLLFDKLRTSKSGNVHWIGHLRDFGTDYRAVITWGAGGFGLIATPDGNFRLETSNGMTRLMNATTGGRRLAPFGDEPLLPPSRPGASIPQGVVSATDQSTGTTQIDVMVLYTNGLAAALGKDGVRTRIEYLVALANQAYVDSQVNIQLRLVYTGEVNYSDRNSLQTALTALTNGSGAFANVASLRQQYGADLVALLQQYDSGTNGACGLAWLNGGNSSHLSATYGYAVAADGNDLGGSNNYCGSYTLAHELGHTMGSAHDRAHAPSPGAYPYSYGYGVSGQFGSIMSYYYPTVGKFSNPAISCMPGLACGISENDPVNSANNALSLNNTRTAVAGFLAPTGLDTTPDGFSFTPLEGVNPGDTLYSESFIVSGLTTPGAGGTPTAVGATAPIGIVGGEYSVDGAPFTSAPGTVANGQSVQVRLVAASGAYAVASAMLTVGTISRAFRVYTRAQSTVAVPAVAAGSSQGLALRADGIVYSWGDNSMGQLGNGGTTSNPLPTAMSTLANVTALAARGSYSLALLGDGSVWTWGDNSSGQLGIGGSSYVTTPTRISALPALRQVASGLYSSVALDTAGQVWEWGFISAPRQVSGLGNAVAVAAGLSHRMALLADGSVVAWGDNSRGQLGVSGTSWAFSPVTVSGLSGVRAIAAGDNFNLALLGDGSVWAWGANEAGQLGDGSNNDRHTPLQVGGLADVTAIAAGGAFGQALRADGILLAWGDNSTGQLGDGTETNRLAPIPLPLANVAACAAGSNNSLAILGEGSIWSWGNNYYGQIGNGIPSGANVDTPVRIGGTSWVIGAADMEPSALSFAEAYAAAGSWGQSASVPVQGISSSTPVSILGGEYSIAGGAFTSTPGLLAPGQTLAVRVLAPDSGSRTATVTVGGLQATFTVTVSLPMASLAPSSLEFGSQAMGASSSLDVTLSNTGTGALVITAIGASGDFGQSNNCGSPLVAGGRCTISVVFSPTATGARTGNLAINDSAGTQTVSLSGTGLAGGGGVTANLVSGWNLIGNGTTGRVDVASVFGDGSKVASVWKWLPGANSGWAFYTPTQANGGAAYAAGKGYSLLAVVNAGEGFWVNAKQPFSVALGSGNPFATGTYLDGSGAAGANPLPQGWSLIAVGDNPTPRAFANGIAMTPPAAGSLAATSITTLWAWYSGDGVHPPGWFFYSPTLDNSAGLANYISNQGYLDFNALGKTLDPSSGFWVNHP